MAELQSYAEMTVSSILYLTLEELGANKNNLQSNPMFLCERLAFLKLRLATLQEYHSVIILNFTVNDGEAGYSEYSKLVNSGNIANSSR